MLHVTVTLPPETERKLREKAVSAGLTLESYLGRLAERDVAVDGTPTPPATFDEVLAPVRQAFRESGMTDEDITDLVQEAREEAWQEALAGKKT